jgi:hypothetical protein
MQDRWSANQIKYQHWLAQSKYDRVPPTKEKLAKDELGVNAATLWRWQQLPGWDEAVTAIALQFLKQDTAEVLQALAREAKKGSIQHIKEFLSLVGVVGEQPTQNTNINQRILVEYADDADYAPAPPSLAAGSDSDGEAF